MATLGYLAIGNRGSEHHLTDSKQSPRAQLLAILGRKSARKVYVDRKDGSTAHIGYIVASEWYTIYTVCDWQGKL